VDPRYVGAEACRSCHPGEFATWQSSHHAPVQPQGPYAQVPGAIAIGSRWMQAYGRPDRRGYVRFLSRCWDLREKRWRAVSRVLGEIAGPGHAAAVEDPAALSSRSFDVDCAGCHASGASLRIDVERDEVASRWRGIACDCEACHGPGRAHMEAADPRGTLPRLESLPERTATALCGRCHGGPPAAGDYTPADAAHHVARLGHEHGVFANGAAAGQVYQQSAFLVSACRSRGGLTCKTCHDPHGIPRLDPYTIDATCLRCHGDIDPSTHTHHDALGAGARCVACHMPKLLTGLLRDVRDHRLGLPLPAAEAVPDACTACHTDRNKRWADRAWRAWWGEPPRDRLEGIADLRRLRSDAGVDEATLRRLSRSPDPFTRAATATTSGRVALFLDDPLPEVRHAAIIHAKGADCGPPLRRALDDVDPVVRAAAWVALGDRRPPLTATLRADLAMALRQDRRLLAMRLAVAEDALAHGHPMEAVDQMERALAYDASRPMLWSLLAAAYQAAGRSHDAALTLVRRPGKPPR